MAGPSSQGLALLHPGAPTPGLAPLSLVLEFARATQSGDPYAFRIGRQDYLLRGAGGSFESAELHWNEPLLADLDAIRRPHRDPLAVQRLGDTLRRFLQPTGWSEHEAHILAALQERRRVVLTLRSAAAELYSLPWELVTLKSTGQHLAELPGLLVRYEWPDTHTAPAQPPAQPAPGRILLGWSAAAGAVPASEHIAAIQQACRSGSHPFSPERDVLENVSLRRLAETLDAAAQSAGPPIAVLHLLCHGGAIGSTFGLTLDGDGDGTRVVVDAGRLRQLLAPYSGMVRLVILSACDSGNSGAIGNQLGSVAQALHRAGLAKVVASRYPLSIVGSIRLAQVLYRELLAGPGSLEEALLTARKQVALDAAQLDWASLQLYARAQDAAFQWVDYLRGPYVPLPAPPLAARLAEPTRPVPPTPELRGEVEPSRSLAQKAVAAVVSEWQERLRRQVDYVLAEADKRLAGLEVEDLLERGERRIQVAPRWRQEFETFVNEAMAGWVGSNTSHVTTALNQALQPAVQGLAAGTPLPGEPFSAGLPRTELFRISIEPTRSQVPGLVSALLHFVRHHVRPVIACLVGVTALTILPSVLRKFLSHGSAAPSSDPLALLLPAGALLFLIFAGYLAAQRDQQDQRQRLLSDRRREISAALKADLQKLAERQRDSLAALLVRQADAALERLVRKRDD